MECNEDAVWNSEFNARALGPEIQENAHNLTLSRDSAGQRPRAVILLSAKMQCWYYAKSHASPNKVAPSFSVSID